MHNKNVHFSSASCEWATPQGFFDELRKEFAFNLDACATQENAKCVRYFSRDVCGLSHNWTGRVWCNPPYGREISDWVAKAWAEVSEPRVELVVMLLPARTDTRWFHDYVMQADEIRFIRGRLKFNGHKNSAPFPSLLAVFRGRNDQR